MVLPFLPRSRFWEILKTSLTQLTEQNKYFYIFFKTFKLGFWKKNSQQTTSCLLEFWNLTCYFLFDNIKVKQMEKQIAFKAFYGDLICLLTASSPYVKETNTEVTGKKIKLDLGLVVSTMRTRLENLVEESCDGRLREKLWDEYCINCRHSPSNSLFLDCILDDSFSKLTCLVQHFPQKPILDGKFYPVRLLEVISDRSPLLQTLSLTIPTHWRLMNSEKLCASFGKSFQNLKHLTDLYLNWQDFEGMVFFFTHLGNSCSQLKQLTLGNSVNFGKKERLALVLGKHASLLPQYLMKKTNENHGNNIQCLLQFSEENVSPLCKSLECLTVLGGAQGKRGRYIENDQVGECYCIGNIPSMVFILRHLPQLKKLDLNRYDYHPGCRNGCDRISNCSLALQLLQKASESTNPVRVSEMSWRDGNDESFDDDFVHFKWSLNSHPRNY